MWEDKNNYREFYTPPPIRNEVTRNARYYALASAKPRSYMLVLNSHKVKVARLLTFSNLLQCRIKSKLKAVKHSNHSCKIKAMFNCSDSGYGSGFGDIITASGLENPDHVGWVMDLSCSKLRWCVVADMLFCIFENDFAENPINVLVLPGFEVKNFVYNSAKRSVICDVEQLGERNKIDTKTVSGMLKYQFILQNNATGKSYAFGMDNKTDLEIWMSVLRNAISLDTDLFEDSDSEYEEDSIVSETSSDLSVNKKGSSVNDSIESESTGQKASHRTYSRTSSGLSDYSFWSNELDGKSSVTSIPGIKVLGRSKSSQNLLSKSFDVFDPPSYMPSPRVTQTRKEKISQNILRDSSNDGKCLNNDQYHEKAFTKVTRSRSFKDTPNENISDSEVTNKSNSSKEMKKLSSVDDFRRKLKINAKTKNDNRKQKLFHKVHSCDSLDIPNDITDWVVIESSETVESGNANYSGEKEYSHLPEKLKKKNSFKDFFSSKQKEITILGSLLNSDVQGYLNHKHLLKWTKYWCVIHQETFYAFKSEEIDSVAEFTLQLKDCSLRLVHSDKGKRIYTFKVLAQNGKSLYFSADTLNDYCTWLELMKKKTNTTDLFKIKEKGDNKNPESKRSFKFSKSQNDSGPRTKHALFYRGLSSTSVASTDSATSSVSMESSKSTNSLTELLKNYKNLNGGHDNNNKALKVKPKQLHKQHSVASFPTSVSHSNMSHTNTHINENVLQRLRAQRKYSVPNISYSDIMEQLTDSKKKDSNNQPISTGKKYSSSSQLSKLLSSSKSKMALNHSSKTPSEHSQNDEENQKNVSTKQRLNSQNKQSKESHIGKENTSNNDQTNSESIMLKSKAEYPHKNSDKTSLVSSGSVDNLRECIPSVPDKPDLCIFNTHLPGPNNEGLLLVREDMDSVEKEKPIIQHHRSYSDGNLNVIEVTQAEDNSTSHKSKSHKSHREAVVLNIAARELNSASIQGYLDRKMEGEEEWVNIWGVLKDDTLFIYQSPIDECSVDSLNVAEWEVQQTDKMKDKHNVLVFKHDEFENQYYSSDSQSDFEHWKEDFHKRAKKSRNSRQVEMKTLEETMLEDLDQQKNELLKYVLSQRKQALKSIQSRRSLMGDSSSQDTDISGSDVTDSHEDFIMVDEEQNWKDMTHMMQRKVSMQLKLDTLQKSLQLQNKKRVGTKKKFKLPFNKSSKTTEDSQTNFQHQEKLSRQVKDLNSRLSYLQLDIDEKKQQMRPPTTDLTNEIQESLHFKQMKAATFEEKPSKFKLSKKFTVSKIKNSFSTADIKMRNSNKEKSSMSLRHSWSPDMWRSNTKDRDLSPTSPDSSASSSSPDHKMSRLSLYSRRSPTRVGYLSSIKDLESPQEEPEELNMSISSSNISQDTSHESSAMKYDSNSSFMDTPMKDIVYRNNNQYRFNDNEQCKTCHTSNDTESIDFEIDHLNGNTKPARQVNAETTAKIEEFEDFLKTRLGSG